MNEATPSHDNSSEITHLVKLVTQRAPLDAVSTLSCETAETVSAVLRQLKPALAIKLLHHLPDELTDLISIDTSDSVGAQWALNRDYPEDQLGRFMEHPLAVFKAETTACDAIDAIREITKEALITYAYVTDSQQQLIGLVVMRDLMLAEPQATLGSIMINNPFHLTTTTSIGDAMAATVQRHYPVYPVCDEAGQLLGEMQGYVLFEEHTFELTAQSGRMVGVEKEEHLHTHWLTSLKYRHPWLQFNLLTAFLAAFVVGYFEETISQIVMLAVFLPVLAGQAGNTGSQSLAITLRGLTLGEFKDHAARHALIKEGLLGLSNGILVGLTAGAAMFAYAMISGSNDGLMLALVVFMAMVGSCVISGITGVLVPLGLEKAGADPSSASAIFLTSITDVVSLGLFLGFATVIIL